MTLAEELQWRGFINQTTFTDITSINEPRTAYFGVDPSADSMTIGNLAPAMMLNHFINHGYKIILLVGGATGMIGDPDGRKQERDLRNSETVNNNVESLKKQLSKIFQGKNFELVNNYDWFKDINYIDFLHRIGKHVSMTQMLDRDFVQQRIGEGGSGISYGEFSYSLIQGYDFLHLYRTKGATVQICGADQWGNSVTGVSLIRKLEGGEAHVFSTPLIINKQTGVKFGKSESGAIWVSPEKTSPYQFYQFWLNTDDEFAKDLIKIYTLLDRNTIEEAIEQHNNNPGLRILQKLLAYEVTKLIHGEERAEAVKNASLLLFSKDNFELTDDITNILANELPNISIGQSLVDSLVDSQIAKSKGEAKRLIANGSVSVNGVKVTEDITIDNISIIKKGKNSFALAK